MKTFLSFIFLWTFQFSCTAQWVALNVGNVNASNFSDVYAITPDIVIVTGNNGTIIKTTNGGASWQQKSSGTTQILGKIQFPTQDIGFIVSAGAQLLKTTDGGDTWLPIAVDNVSSIYSMSCVNENLIFLSCIDSNNNSILLKSINGGSSWEKIIGNDAQMKFYDIQFLSGETGYASNNNVYHSSENNILKTLDGGKNWTKIDNSRGPFNFINENKGFSYQFGFLKTTDGGNNFERLGQSSLYLLSKIFSINENTVWGIFEDLTLCGCGTRGLVRMTYGSEDGYKEYVQIKNAFISSIYFSNVKLGYAVGVENGKASVWKNMAADLTLNTGEVIKNSINIYPNPTSDKINISINHQYSKEFTISISDMAGKSVYNQSFKNRNELSIDAKGFTKGIYILNLKNQKQNYTQKIIIQ
ncbi:T9SS type A sorting domain-containing protein [Epilithonimonas sp. JDS]|uniref:T9SS type A sorting domain-containing protein n=1 Tax=Epilithonimonas sp. JDS TaxID=2902797 RepID=UPI001E5B9C46|nr:T9SS type A sorting domain-containing protein [Epilithonimonas sp. JDS]MCD9853154.1 T9SS type A sorting domain-containing protein [Epilithonimonas sp. JDS]